MLALIALKFFGLAWTFHVSAVRLTANGTFDVILRLAPLDIWVAVFIIIGIAALAGLARPRMLGLRVIAVISVGIEVIFGLGFLFAGTASPAAVTFLALAGADLILASLPPVLDPA